MTSESQPGLSALRDAVAARWKALPRAATLKSEAIAGLSCAISSVSDGMAGSLLAGVNPIYGLYAAMVGPLVGGLFVSTVLMRVTSTSASALTAGEVIGPLPETTRDSTLFLLVLLIGTIQILAGALRLGRFTRFVSHSVMVGFLSGVAVLIILGQIPTLTGYSVTAPNKVLAALGVLSQPASFDLATVAIAGLALALAIFLPRTRLGSFGTLFALIIPSIVTLLPALASVALVEDISQIPSGLPIPGIPSFDSLSLDLVTGALAVAVIVLIQGAGVGQSVPNPGGGLSSPSRDFLAQGAANVASGLFQGVPVGGSANQTALNVVVGAQTRWASILSGIWMAIILLLIPGAVGKIAMPALAALLVLAGAGAIRPQEFLSIWSTGWSSRIAVVTTFVATLFLPIQVAVGIGVVLSALLHLNRSSIDIGLVELVERPDGRVEERQPPAALPSAAITVLDVYGSLYFAGARTLERLLPSPAGADRPVVVLRLRGRTQIGATLVDVLANYARRVEAANGRLLVSGVDPHVYEQMVRTGKIRLNGPPRIFPATPILGESSRQAIEAARDWLAAPSPDR
jgi:SulP family sulfate permease